jgi:lipopolysaccharide/colanic/teichoic acid biosynthesis glycosyltransferase
MTQIVVLGAGGMGREAAAWLADVVRAGQVAGFLDEDASQHGTSVAGLTVLGGLAWLEDRRDTEVVVAIGSPVVRAGRCSRNSTTSGARLATVVHPTATVGPRVRIATGAIACPGVVPTCDIDVRTWHDGRRRARPADRRERSLMVTAGRSYDRIKRTMDVVLAATGMVLLPPVFALIAWRVRRQFGTAVLFRQQRPGVYGQPFTLDKFRTMSDERGPDGQLLPDEQRLTRFGRRLRSTSLDELPELWNVLKGDMSLVGPRPLLVEYLDLSAREQARRHEVRPDITGWPQINGRNNQPWSEKLALDVWYVDNRSLWLDLRTLLRTLAVMATRRGVSLAGRATTVRFSGVQGEQCADTTDDKRR